jgi:hypothetical protein
MKQGGKPVGSGVSVTFAANSDLGLSAETRTTDNNGRITLKLTGGATGNQTVSATIGGQTVTCTITVTDATTYTFDVSPNTLLQGNPTPVTFTMKQGGKPVGSGVSVTFDANPDLVGLLSAVTRTTDNNGKITLTLKAPTNGTPGKKTVSATIGGEKVDFQITVNPLKWPLDIQIIDFENGVDFTNGNKLYSTASLKATVVDADGLPVSGATVIWSVVSAQNNSSAMAPGWKNRKSGLTWGSTPEAGLTEVELPQERIVTDIISTTAASGETTMQLTDIVGERVITVQAKVCADAEYTASQAVSFGKGPLSVFRAAPGDVIRTWPESYKHCNGSVYPGDPSTWNSTDWVGGDHMPTRAQLQAVSAYNVPPGWGIAGNPNIAAQGAAWAAGWGAGGDAEYGVWTGEASDAGRARYVFLDDGSDIYDNGNIIEESVDEKYYAVCVYQH